MRIIELDASGWNVPLDFYGALLAALGAPQWHGTSINALSDSMIWSEEIDTVKPPYIVKVINASHVPADVQDELHAVRDWLPKSRREFHALNGRDRDVTFEVA